jgi:hypothetical protein
MKQRVKALIIEITRIIESYTDSEIGEAIDALRELGTGKALVEYLSEFESPKHSPGRDSSRSAKTRSKPVDMVTSRAVLRLKDSQHEKFVLLSEFDQLIRSGKVLSSNEALRRFGERLSKDFVPRKSRRESIGAVMEVLAESSFEECRDLIRSAVVESERGGNDGYQNLANFLIKGRMAE